ncbi:MAG: PorV/PorQ family protein [Chitinophagales bacterium]|nr:PorV/PorQ family protein [Chitinophagales bacterium]
MTSIFKGLVFTLGISVATIGSVSAGNPDRAGEAGAYELLINPFARSSGLYGLNTSSIRGVEALAVNPAGLAHLRKTEITFSRTQWLQGSGIGINTVGIAQKFGKDKSNVIGFNLNNIQFGEIDRTTTTNPEGGLGTFKPSYLNFGLGYARAFSNSIFAGVNVKFINERIEDLGASGFAIDAGIQYITGPRNNIHFGLALRNVGVPMRFTGDGLTFRGNAIEGDYQMSQNQKTEKFDLPSQLNIGAGYDWWLDAKTRKENPYFRLSFSLAFIANSFGKDQFGAGMEFGYREMFQARVGYRYEKGLTSAVDRTSAHTGLSAGMTVEVPFKKEGPALAIDYSYRSSSPFTGTHSIGLRFNL